MITPKIAYKIALKKGPSDYTREMASKNATYAYKYALKIDKHSHNITRKGTFKVQNIRTYTHYI